MSNLSYSDEDMHAIHYKFLMLKALYVIIGTCLLNLAANLEQLTTTKRDTSKLH